jgi:hypothetical protein
VDKDTWEFYPVVGAHALLELMKCQQVTRAVRCCRRCDSLCAPHQQRLNTEMLRLKDIKEKQLKSLRVRCS